MKKLFKLTLIVLLIASLAFVVTGCGNKNNEENDIVLNNNETNDNGKSKTYNAFNKVFADGDYVMSLEGKTDMGEGIEDVAMTVAAKGDNIYMDVKATSGNATIIYKDNTTYMIVHDNKMYMTTEGKDESISEDMTFVTKEDLSEMENQEYNTGKEEIDGNEYEYEEYTDDKQGITERYYFSGNDLKYVKSIDEDGTEEIMKITKMTSEVDDSLFEIPSDYQKIEM